MDTYLVNKDKIDIEEVEYRRLRFDDKISHIKNYLNQLVLEFLPSLYPILSKGVHELSEEECKQYFNPLKLGIKAMLDEKIRDEQEERDKKELKKSLAEIKGKLT